MKKNKNRRFLRSVSLFILMAFCITTMAPPVYANQPMLKLDRTELTLNLGKNDTLRVVEKWPEFASVIWRSSNPDVAKVTYYGLVVPLSEGTTVITAIIRRGVDFSAECRVTVKAAEPTEQPLPANVSLRLHPSSVDLKIGETVAPNLIITPSDTAQQNIGWLSSNPAVAEVDRGTIRAVSEGTAVVTASLMGQSATCSVRVAPAPAPQVPPSAPVLTGIRLNKTELRLRPLVDEVLVAELIPAHVSHTTITWTTTNPQVVTVKPDGRIRAISDGVAIITARAGGYTADCRVQVQTEVESVSILHTMIDLKVGQKTVLQAGVQPRGAISSGFIWTSQYPDIATIDAAGKVIALKEGTTFIYVESDGKTCNTPATVTVSRDPVKETKKEEIRIYPQDIYITHQQKSLAELKQGDVINLYAVPMPITANQLDGFTPLRWTSSNPSVARVDASGKVEFLSAGTVTITVKTADGRYTNAANFRAGATSLPAILQKALSDHLQRLLKTLENDGIRDRTLLDTGVRG